MTREKLTEELKRMNRIQKSVLKASREPHDPATDDLIEAVAQLTLTVNELLKEHRE